MVTNANPEKCSCCQEAPRISDSFIVQIFSIRSLCVFDNQCTKFTKNFLPWLIFLLLKREPDSLQGAWVPAPVYSLNNYLLSSCWMPGIVSSGATAVNGVEGPCLYEPFSLVAGCRGAGGWLARSHTGNHSHKWYLRKAQMSREHLTWGPRLV